MPANARIKGRDRVAADAARVTALATSPSDFHPHRGPYRVLEGEMGDGNIVLLVQRPDGAFIARSTIYANPDDFDDIAPAAEVRAAIAVTAQTPAIVRLLGELLVVADYSPGLLTARITDMARQIGAAIGLTPAPGPTGSAPQADQTQKPADRHQVAEPSGGNQ